jgi:uncharacterized protein DUF1236
MSAAAAVEETMKARLLTAVAAVALVGGTVFVAAQEKQTPGGASPPAGQAEPPGKPGADPKATQPKGAQQKNGAPPKSADPKAQDGTPPKGTAQPKSPEPKGTAQPKGDKAAPKADTKGSTAGDKPTTDQKFEVTTEQRTQIRQTILKQGNAPRVTNVNFTVSVGTVVPSTVQVVVLPPAIVEIYPRWRGYRYFIVDERIVIVEPNTLRIVFIIDA